VVGFARFIDFWASRPVRRRSRPTPSCPARPSSTAIRSSARSAASPTPRSGSVNLYGAPALSARKFKGYRQEVIFGASLQVTAPLGQYDETRLVNIGMNR